MKLPIMGLGTFQMKGDVAYKATKYALEVGYRHIDTAEIYKNQSEIGKAILESGIPRENLFITSKLAPNNLSYNGAISSCDTALSQLGTTYLDLFLIHWPARAKVNSTSDLHKSYRKEAWKALESLKESGKCRFIGVSNYTIPHLEDLLSYCEVKPFANQIELHPFLQQKETVRFCQENDIQVIPYSSLGHGNLIENETIQEMAAEKQIDAGQFLLLWAIQKGFAVIPKSKTEERILKNYKTIELNITLSEEDMEKIDKLDRNWRYCWDPTEIH
jgi:diketogulonate reductase-like aldo/keto reductase